MTESARDFHHRMIKAGFESYDAPHREMFVEQVIQSPDGRHVYVKWRHLDRSVTFVDRVQCGEKEAHALAQRPREYFE